MALSEVDDCEYIAKFNLLVVYESFSASLVGENDLEIDAYLKAYKELLKFFQLMGSVFGFVATDVKNKIEILEEFRKGNERDNFSTLKMMIKYESETGLLKKSNYVSGCRTLLRLHRGLDFIRVFLQRVGELENGDKTTGVCQVAYNETLAQYHSWVVRKGALLAMYTLPTREGLLQKVCGNPTEVETAIQLLPKMLNVAASAYNLTEKAYTDHDLHDLP